MGSFQEIKTGSRLGAQGAMEKSRFKVYGIWYKVEELTNKERIKRYGL
jgi:hypothetical protein